MYVVAFNHLKTNSTKLAHYRLKIRNVIGFEFQSLMQHPILHLMNEIVIADGHLPKKASIGEFREVNNFI